MLIGIIQTFYDYKTYFKRKKERQNNPNLMGATKIIDRLYLGSVIDALNKDECYEHGNNWVVNVCHKESWKTSSMWLPLNDNYGNDYNTFWCAVRGLQGLHALGFNILVHCVSGINRSASVIIAFLAVKYSITYNEAFDMVKEFRPFIRPMPQMEEMAKKYIAQHKQGK